MLDKDSFAFQNWKDDLVFNNDAVANDLSYQDAQNFLYHKLTSLHLSLQSINENSVENNNDLIFVHNQLSCLLDYFFTVYEKSKDIKILSINIMNLFAKTLTYNLSTMMKNGHEKFNISLIELVNKLIDFLSNNLKKLSMSKNWFSSLKHLSIIILKLVFTKFNGFLNNVKNQLITIMYKHLSKVNDSYNSSVENGTFKSNYINDSIHLIDIILTHDNSNLVLDDKLYTRLFKLVKFMTQRNQSSSSSSTSVFTYPLTSIILAFSILNSLLKSDKFLLNLTSNKKYQLNSLKYLNSIKDYTAMFFMNLDSDHKKLKLALTKHLSDLLVYTYVVFGTNINDSDFALESCLNLLLFEYKKSSTSANLKSAMIEAIIQFISKLNLYFQTNRIKILKSSNNINFVSFKFFDIINILYTSLFELPSNSDVKKNSKEQSENCITINNSITLNFAIKTLNHLELIHKFLIGELDNDMNKLIVLSKLILGNSTTEQGLKIKCLDEMIFNNGDTILNIWYSTNLLKFSQLLIEDLNEFVLSDHGSLSTTDVTDIASQLVNKISNLCLNKNFRLRVIAVETLVKLLRVKPELSYDIMNDSLNKLLKSFDDQDNSDNQAKFNDNYSNAYLISSILTFSSKEYITSDFILKVFSLSLDFLKKFNTSVVSTNLFGSNSGIYISNLDYEKQLVSWILLLGLFNYASNDENIDSNNLFLQDSNQFLSIWKNLLAHTLPNGFLQIDTKSKSITNINEIMKIIEIKNQSLVCLITYISYLTSNKLVPESSSDDDLIRQLNSILTKSYSFIIQLTKELNSLNMPKFLENSLNGNKLRIFEAYLKLLPYLNIKNEINSTMLIEITKNFCDIEKFRYKFQDPYGKFIRNSKKKIQINSISEYLLYYIDDGIWYGLTSKFNNFKIDELMIKNKIINNEANNKSESDIDFVKFHNQFLIESSTIQSNLSNISIFDETTESRNFIYLNHSLLHDSFMLLYNNSYDIGYTDTMKYPVPTDTMSIDTSIELFALSFGHLSSKIQLSVLESIRSFIFYESKESKSTIDFKNDNFDENDENNIKLEFSLMLRKKAISVNSSIAIHSLLNYMLRYNSRNNEKIRFKKEVANLIIETLKNINFEDIYLVNLNSESIGICCSLVEGMEIQEELLHNQITIIINSIIETSIPNIRAFAIKSLAQLTKFSNLVNTTRITNTLFTLLLDPHPIVHSATLYALDIFMNGKSNLEISNELSNKILNYLQNIWLSDNFGIRSVTTISSNINFREHSNSVNLTIKLIRSLININGPMIRLWDDTMKIKLNHILFNLQYLVNFDYEIVIRELLKVYEELLVFDKSIININNYKTLTKMLILNNFKIGVYGNSLSNLPFDDEYDNENTIELFPCTTSKKLLNISLESAFQLFKLEENEIIDVEFEKLLWIALEMDPNNESIKNIVKILMQDSIDKGTNERFEWFNKLINYFNINKNQLTEPLMTIFEKRINNAGMYFHSSIQQQQNKVNKRKQKGDLKSTNGINQRPEELNEAEETLTSEQTIKDNNGKSIVNGGGDDAGGDDDDDDNDDDDNDDNDENFHNYQSKTNDSITINILDLSNEQINWKFKLFIIEMLNTLLGYCTIDSKLKLSLSKYISEFVRISFISSTSNLIKLRISSLKLLGKIIELYSNMKDPMYPDISILDQQQAQIMSTIIPSFNKESTIELAGEGIILSSKFISSNITNVSKSGRLIKILTKALEDISSNIDNDNGNNSRELIKIGDIPILTNKSENKIKICILQAWCKILVLNEVNSNRELNLIIEKYIKLLILLWVNSIREFAMIKYSTIQNFDISKLKINEGLNLKIYESCWIDFIESICIVINNETYYELLVSIIGYDEVGKLFMIILGLCLEYLIKKSNKPLGVTGDDIRILKSLNKLFKLDLSIKILFNDYIFCEFIDVINKLIITCNDSIEILNNINELLKDVFIQYFNDLTVDDGDEEGMKSIDEIYSDFDKLFEFLRLNIKIISIKLKLKDETLTPTLDGTDLIILKKSFSSFIEMVMKLPNEIQIDLYSNLIYILILINNMKNDELLIILLPIFQKILINYKSLVEDDENLKNIFQILEINSISKSNQLLTFIILKTIPNILIFEKDVKLINEMLINGIISEDSNLISLSVQTIKSIISNLNTNSFAILKMLIPKLIEILSDDEVTLNEPRLIIEIFITFIKKLAVMEDNSQFKSSYELIIPIMLYFNFRFGYDSYTHDKLLELIELNPGVFKEFINMSSVELKANVQKLLTMKEKEEVTDGDNTTSHIKLKIFD